MSEEFRWLSEAVVHAIHDRVIAEHGGEGGLLDIVKLQGALARPLHAVAYEKSSVFQAAAFYAHGIVKSHGYNDGNKRTAFVAAATFLELNGYRLEASEVEATRAMLELAESRIDVASFAQWLEDSSARQK